MFFLFSPHKFRVVEEERNRFDRMEGKASRMKVGQGGDSSRIEAENKDRNRKRRADCDRLVELLTK